MDMQRMIVMAAIRKKEKIDPMGINLANNYRTTDQICVYTCVYIPEKSKERLIFNAHWICCYSTNTIIETN